VDPTAKAADSGPCVTETPSGNPSEEGGAGSLDQIFTGLLSALKEVNAVLTEAKVALVHIDQTGGPPPDLPQLQDPAAPGVRRRTDAPD
jgi:hypothetical protein